MSKTQHSRSRRRTLLPACAALLAGAAFPGAARAGVLVVDATGAGDFTTLQAAITAAASGDTLLVRTDTGDNVIVIDGKALTIVGDVPPGSALRRTIGAAIVLHLAANQQVVLRNLLMAGEVVGGGGSAEAGLDLADNAGSVWVENCSLLGAEGNGMGWGPCFTANLPGGAGLSAVNCATVTVTRCTLAGGPGAFAYSYYPIHLAGQATNGGAGLRAQASQVALYESTLLGGPGGGGHLCQEVADGGPGLDALSAARVLLSGCSATGSVQGAGPPAGAPGSGMRADNTSTLELLASSATPAPGAVPFDTAPGAVADYAGNARSFALTSPLREGEAGTLTIAGVPGDFVGFFWSFQAGFKPMPARNGWFLLGSGFIAGPFFVGTISSPGGTWSIPFPAPTLPPASAAMTFLLQAWCQYPGGVTLASGTAFTLLDQSL